MMKLSVWEVFEDVALPVGLLALAAAWALDLEALAAAGGCIVALGYVCRLVRLGRAARRGGARRLDRETRLGLTIVTAVLAIPALAIAALVGVVTALFSDIPVLRGAWHATRAMLVVIAGATVLTLLEHLVKRLASRTR